MEIIISETGETRELEYRINGIDAAADFVANNSDYPTNEDGNPIMSACDYAWWTKTIPAHEDMTIMIAKYVQQYGDDAVDEALSKMHSLDVDLGDQPARVARNLAEWFDS